MANLVIESFNNTTNSIKDKDFNAKKKQIQLSYGKRISLSELLDVSAGDVILSIDDNSLIKIDEFKLPNEAIFINESYINYEENKQFSSVQNCRVAIYIQLIKFLQGKLKISSEILQFLIYTINNDVVPAFISDDLSGQQLIDYFHGFGYVYYNQTIYPANEIFTLLNIETIKISKYLSTYLQSSTFLTTSVTARYAAISANIVSLLDPISALSCEYIGIDLSYFDSSYYESNRQHRGQINSANNIKNLLDGSKRCKVDSYNEVFSSIPQANGSIQELLKQTITMIDIEINSSEEISLTENKTIIFKPFPSKIALKSLETILVNVIEITLNRLKVLGVQVDISTEVLSIQKSKLTLTPSNDNFKTIDILIDVSFHLLNDELLFVLERLYEIEKTNDSNVFVKEVNDQSKSLKPQIDESHLTPEQKLKAEAKRKQKLERQLNKLKEKEAKKTIVSSLGVGTSQLRSYLSSKSINKVSNQISPYSNNFVLFYNDLLEKLNSSGTKRRPKIAKGTRDYGPEQMRIREQVFSTIRRVFKRHGGVEIDTPVFELKEVLTGKYGEDSKLIYDLADQGGELLSLRYDLTVPFARFLAMNSVGNIKRYHIAKVYRRDQPQLSRGRYREFYQCDFDIAGNYQPMVPDAEAITVAIEILSELPIGSFIVKLNHRKILDAIFEISGVPIEKFRPICSAVDKLDKLSWEDVKKEMIYEKGLTEEVADKIGHFVNRKGNPRELLQAFTRENIFGDNISANSALADMKLLFDYLDAMGTLDFISFDMSLARGLDYYTGVIYEFVLTDGTSQVGSISAGGRYDNLVGMFSVSGTQTPCVGVSIGVERVFAILEKKAEELKLLQSSIIQVYIASIGPGLITQRMKIANILWKANISAEYSHLENPKLVKQLEEALERHIPYMIVFGEDELNQGNVKLKVINEKKEIVISIDNIVNALIENGCQIIPSGSDLSLIESMK